MSGESGALVLSTTTISLTVFGLFSDCYVMCKRDFVVMYCIIATLLPTSEHISVASTCVSVTHVDMCYQATKVNL